MYSPLSSFLHLTLVAKLNRKKSRQLETQQNNIRIEVEAFGDLQLNIAHAMSLSPRPFDPSPTAPMHDSMSSALCFLNVMFTLIIRPI